MLSLPQLSLTPLGEEDPSGPSQHGEIHQSQGERLAALGNAVPGQQKSSRTGTGQSLRPSVGFPEVYPMDVRQLSAIE